MFRMGRNNNSEQPAETPQQSQQLQENSPTANALYRAQPQAQSGQPMANPTGGAVVSESEAMARDIKEGRLSGFVGHGTVLTGETNFQAMLRVDGHLTGRVTSEKGTLIVGSSGRVDANIMVAVAQINGTVNGDIVALEKVELGRSANVTGNIQTPRLTIQEGALLEGGCSMTKAREVLEQRMSEARGQAQQQAQQEAQLLRDRSNSIEVTVDDDEEEAEEAEETREKASIA